MLTFDIPDDPDLADLASRQHGVIAAAQLDALGVSLRTAQRRVKVGRWQRPHQRVYAVFSGPLDRTATIWAAILRCGEGATASHETAAELEGLSDRDDDCVHVTIANHRRVRGSLAGIRVHLSHRVAAARHPARVPPRTRIEETVVDLADASRSARKAADWITTAIRKRMTTPDRLATALASRKKFAWRAIAEAMLVDVAEGAHSPLELEHLYRVERSHGLPRGTRQRRHEWGKSVTWIDVDHEEYRTRIELDGRLGHEGDGVFRDRRRDNRGVVDGAVTLRYGYVEVFESSCEVAAEEALVLQSQGWDGQPEPCGADCPIFAVLAEMRADRRAA